ncbi:MAG: HlyC/CorC family transporter [Nevskiaceae bacterium]
MTKESGRPRKRGDAPSWWRALTQKLGGGPQTREGLLAILHGARDHKVVDGDALLMIEGVLGTAERQVRDIMVPRAQMVIVQQDFTLDQILPVVVESGHSRFPVVTTSKDKVIGILLAKDLLRFTTAAADQSEFDLDRLMRPAVFVPESKRVNVLLKEFRGSRNHMAIVVDEYSGVAGLVTIEDVLEQIVGDIEDEYDFDEASDNILPEPGGRFRVKALTQIADFNSAFGSDFSDEEHDTVGGLVIAHLGRLPRRGETLSIAGLKFQVLRADSRRVYTLIVEKPKA